MRLIDLLDRELSGVQYEQSNLLETKLTGIACNSRDIRPGYLFAALPGSRVDGRAFIADAIDRGCIAVLAPPGSEAALSGTSIPLIIDDNPRRRFALMAARFFSGQPRQVVAVTGTNGKTSVAVFLQQIWTRLGHRAASMGTLGVHGPGVDVPASLTTLDPATLHQHLADLAEKGIDQCVIEASSHGLSQYRLDGVRIKAAAFTNLTRDHLDYHGDMDRYLAAKVRLFADILPHDGTAVVNADALYSDAIEAACRARGIRRLTFGAGGKDIRLNASAPHAHGQVLDLTVFGSDCSVDLPLLGGFQASNALCALGLALACGEDVSAAVATLEKLEGAPGRVQRIATLKNGAVVFVDYAHTPDALGSVLGALRPHVGERLHLVFGCGGDRDAGKRPEMGAIARRLADDIIITNDNPRHEDAATIRNEIAAACTTAKSIGDRGQAIRAAIAALGPGDLLVVAGKGHEQGQVIGDEILPFDDAEEIITAIREQTL